MNKPQYIIEYVIKTPRINYKSTQEFDKSPTFKEVRQLLENISFLFNVDTEDIDIKTINLKAKETIKSLAKQDIEARKSIKKTEKR